MLSPSISSPPSILQPFSNLTSQTTPTTPTNPTNHHHFTNSNLPKSLNLSNCMYRPNLAPSGMYSLPPIPYSHGNPSYRGCPSPGHTFSAWELSEYGPYHHLSDARHPSLFNPFYGTKRYRPGDVWEVTEDDPRFHPYPGWPNPWEVHYGSLNGSGSFNGSFGGNGGFVAISPNLPPPGSGLRSGWNGEFGVDVHGNRGFKETGSNGKEWLNLGVPSEDHDLFNEEPEPVVERYTNGVRDEPTRTHKRRTRRRKRPSPPPPIIEPPPNQQIPPPPPPPPLLKTKSADAVLETTATFSPTAADLNLHDRHFFPKTYTDQLSQAVLAGKPPNWIDAVIAESNHCLEPCGSHMSGDSPTYGELATMVEALLESGSEIRMISPAEW